MTTLTRDDVLARIKALAPGGRLNLSGTDLSDADLSGANLRWADLSGADLSWADLSAVSYTHLTLPTSDLV